MPLQATSGAASYDAFGGGVPVVPNYIEDVFSCFLYTGTGNSVTQRIASGIDLATKGGMVWVKNRTEVTDHQIYDTARGQRKYIRSNTTDAEFDSGANQVQYKTSGWDAFEYTNELNKVMASWTFRKQPKFFDVVTYTGNGSAGGQTITHSLTSTPGCIIVKRTDAIEQWRVYHTTQGVAAYAGLNSTAAFTTDANNPWKTPTSTTFGVGDGTYWTSLNASGGSYVAYIFAHDAGGFGLTGTDNVISCGSYTGNGSSTGPEVNIGYEPQWLLVKEATQSGNAWSLFDNMRGLSVSGPSGHLRPNASDAEDTTSVDVRPTATGFQPITSSGRVNRSGETFIYIAIRRGPMKVPTVGTSVYNNLANRVGTSATATISGVGFPVDLMLPFNETSGSTKPFVDRLRGATKYLLPPYSNAEQTNTDVVTSFASNDGVIVGADSLDVINNYYNASRRYAASFFRRAPSVFDIVCYTGTEVSGQTFNHNLGAVPEMMIVKSRSDSTDWTVYHSALGASARIYLNATNAANTGTAAPWNSTTPTSSVFSLGNAGATNLSGATFVNYLFSTAAGVSKVGSYTGTGALQTINCGFTSGARFILIKRTDSTGDWYMYDSARGISASSDPYLLLNTTGASELGTNYVDTDSTGFKVTAAAPAALNANGGSYIFFAVA